jgi:hypothetical protein
MQCGQGKGKEVDDKFERIRHEELKEREEEDWLDHRCRKQEAAVRENAASHDERVLRLVGAGYHLQESMRAISETYNLNPG